MKFDLRIPLIAIAALFSLPAIAPAQDKVQDKPAGDNTVHLQQGWSADTADRWHFISQGTALIPYDWFLALEQPLQTELIRSADNLRRLGFLVEPTGPTNPDGLAVGLYATPVDFPDGKYACWKGNWLGLGCAGCHTGQVSYRGQQIRIEGGPAHIDIDGLVGQLTTSIAWILKDPQAAGRFMARVKAPAADVQRGLACFGQVLQAGQQFGEIVGSDTGDTKAGAGRLDAHGAGLNQLLAGPMSEPANYAHLTAPVRYPALWDTPRFNWVLYNSSIRQPLARNVVEALGVQAPIKHDNTMLGANVVHRVQMENVAWGQRTLMDLRSPRWPETILGALDLKKVANGKLVYADACASCHDAAPAAISPEQGACSEIQVPLVHLDRIGTDPEQATTFAKRKVTLSRIGGPDQIANYKAAEIVTGNITEQWIGQSRENAAAANAVNCGRPNQYRALLAYRARPLNGIWATAPYLHNGSVPSLHDLLLPPEQRPRTFYVGNWEFNPELVGYEMKTHIPGAFLFDTTMRGNSNAGHVYGTELSEEDRRALIEYLKTL